MLLLEQGQLSCGTTWHAAGLVGLLRATESGTRLVQYSTELYARLEAETGLSAGFRRCGGLIVARTPERLTQLRRTAAAAAAFGLQAEMLTPAQAGERYPLMETGRPDRGDLAARRRQGQPDRPDLRAGQGGPQPGRHDPGADPGDRDPGRRRAAGGRAVTGVRTDEGDIEAEIVVNCAGQWAKQVGGWCGVTVPLHSCEHFYVVTDQIDGVHRDLPVLRDPDGYTYFKEEVGGLLVGGFEPEAKPWVDPEQIPYPFEFQLLGEDWEHFAILMEQAQLRIPALREAGIKKFYNGPESFTPDNQFIIGEAPELRDFFVAAGFNSVGIASAGGAGRALAEWILSGDPGLDLTAADIRRFARFHGNTSWLRDRVGEVLGLHYAVPWPNRELRSARPLRRSPVHHLLAAGGRVLRQPDGLGAAQRVRPARGDAGDRLLLGRAELAALVRGRAAGRPPGRGPVRPDLVLQVPADRAGRRAGAAVAVHRGRRGPARAGWCTPGCSTRRGRYESDLTVTRLSAGGIPAGQQLGHHRAGQRSHHGNACPRVRTPAWST